MQALLVPGEPNAEMRIELIGRAEPSVQTSQTWAHDRMTLHTGRKQQLRAQTSALGRPRVGDRNCPQLPAREFSVTGRISGRQHCFVSQCRLQHAG